MGEPLFSTQETMTSYFGPRGISSGDELERAADLDLPFPPRNKLGFVQRLAQTLSKLQSMEPARSQKPRELWIEGSPGPSGGVLALAGLFPAVRWLAGIRVRSRAPPLHGRGPWPPASGCFRHLARSLLVAAFPCCPQVCQSHPCLVTTIPLPRSPHAPWSFILYGHP